MKGTDQECFPGVTHFTQVDVQPGGINIQHVEHLYQADFLKSLGIELEVKRREADAAVESGAGAAVESEAGAAVESEAGAAVESEASPKEVVELSPQRHSMLGRLLELAGRGDWHQPASVEYIGGLLEGLARRDEFWHLLEQGRGDRVRVTWQNLVGYFAERGFLPAGLGSPALNKMFFGQSADDYQNIDKGRRRDSMSAGFRALLPLIDELMG